MAVMGLAFYRMSTAGNTTLLTEAECDFKGALACIPAEQAGWLDLPRRVLTMGGGELCVNACLAGAALLRAREIAAPAIHCAGQKLKIWAHGQAPLWQAGIELPAALARLDLRDGINVVAWPGIAHALAHCQTLPSPAEALQKAPGLIRQCQLDDAPAAGVTWWTETEDGITILPVVHVPALDTLFLEGACGSASLSLGRLLPEGEYAIRQASGEVIIVRNAAKTMALKAPVRLLASGELWLE